ncbi:proteasome-type protease [Alcanivorax hongdengensis A-11-3]|uniref:Proteasome-type protease n=1 Tax=Alcanivorax hongdengensis A-11-3 TaxID=1177179 RepID=L0WE03_9GAMM|nr:proteasome-type protease [Alcanivorax hongdengensis]EKF75063.1 proteasome-type protease [Alcanivorax hongdengensis A-11-3]
MTYCVAMALKDGLVFAADSRTNAGVDQIATYRKLHKFTVDGERVIILLSAGNLATTQSVISLLKMRLGSDQPNLFGVQSLYEAATVVGNTSREVVRRDSGQSQGKVDFGCSFIVGGQVHGEPPRLFLVYPEGNFIECTPDTPYFQIGETKYGKPILDRVIDYDLPLEQAAKCALISLDSTIRSNLSVGLPLDVLLYDRNSFCTARQFDITEDNVYFRALGEAWSVGLRQAFSELPEMDW